MSEPTTKSTPYLFFLGLGGILCVLLYSNPLSIIPTSFLGSLPNVNNNVTMFNSSHDEFFARYRDGCPAHQFKSVKQISRAPDIMLIEGFITEPEIEVLLRLGEPNFKDSSVVTGDNEYYVLDKEFRDSWSAYLDWPSPNGTPDETVLNCIEERATAFQGYIPRKNMEGLQVVKYYENQHFKEHYDWLDPADPETEEQGNRVTSFFVYLVANCTGGTTVFPRVARPKGEKWCDALKCHNDDGGEVEWLEVKPKVGTAIFWYNMDPKGKCDDDTLHTGTPVKDGIKVGLNVWTRNKQFRTW